MFTLQKLTPNNIHNNIGCFCLFITRGEYVIRRIMRASKSGKSIQIAPIDTNQNKYTHIQIVTRKVYKIVDIKIDGYD